MGTFIVLLIPWMLGGWWLFYSSSFSFVIFVFVCLLFFSWNPFVLAMWWLWVLSCQPFSAGHLLALVTLQNWLVNADLPARPYLPILVRKSAGSTDVRRYFSKYGHRVSKKYGNRSVNNASLLPAKPIVEHWWGVIVCCHLHISSHFRGWSMRLVLIGQKSLTSEHQLCIETLRKLTIFLYDGFEFEVVNYKWLRKTSEEEEECTKPRKQTPTIQQPFKKGRIDITEISTHGALILEKVFCGLWWRTTFADINKIKSSECSAYNWRCEFTHCSYKMIDRKIYLWLSFVLTDWLCIRKKKSSKKSENTDLGCSEYWQKYFGVGRSVNMLISFNPFSAGLVNAWFSCKPRQCWFYC